jgi:regulator of nonsense transcripts 1
MEWNMYDAGSIATGEAMMNALRRLSKEQSEACSFWGIIAGEADGEVVPEAYERIKDNDPAMEGLNPSQKSAIMSATSSQISLIWGPPGTLPIEFFHILLLIVFPRHW